MAIDTVVAASKARLYETGITAGLNALNEHPDWGRVRMALATVLIRRNRFEEAIALIRTGLTATPSNLDLRILFLRVLTLTNRDVEGLPYALETLRANPNSPPEPSPQNSTCTYEGLMVYCGPADCPPGRHSLYRNNGDGTFTDVSLGMAPSAELEVDWPSGLTEKLGTVSKNCLVIVKEGAGIQARDALL